MTKSTIEEVSKNYLNKLNKVRRLKLLCKKARIIVFMVHTPTSISGNVVQCVFLLESEVQRCNGGYYVITGRNAVREIQDDLESGKNIKATKLYKDRIESDKAWRSYRIDSIIDGSIFWK